VSHVDAEARLDYQALERELCRLPDVTAARIVVEPGGRATEVHVLAAPTKGAKQIVRDVQSVAVAVFGIELDRRIISVVQFEAPRQDAVPNEPVASAPAPPAEPAPEPVPAPSRRRSRAEPTDRLVESTESESQRLPSNGLAQAPTGSRRISVETVTAVRNGPRLSAQVELRRGDDQAIGIAEGLMVSGSEPRIVAAATLSALRQFEPAAERAEVETAALVQLGDRGVAVASIIFFVPPYEEIVAGSAMVRSAGENDAVVRAVLDATNRRLGRAGRDRDK
jgi:hypothetical protein